MQATIKDGKLIIEMDLQTPPAPSASGKHSWLPVPMAIRLPA